MKNITMTKEQLNACFGMSVTDHDLVAYAEKWREQTEFSPIKSLVNTLSKDYIYVDTDSVKTSH